MSDFVIFKTIKGITSLFNKNKIEYFMMSDDLKEIDFVCYENKSNFTKNFQFCYGNF